jgi:hypothetical protein
LFELVIEGYGTDSAGFFVLDILIICHSVMINTLQNQFILLKY